MPFSPSDFAEDTALERLALEVLGAHRVRLGEAAAIVHDEAKPVGRGRSNVSMSTYAHDSLGPSRDLIVRPLRPLSFGAAYKVLDLLIEHVLWANAYTPAGRTFRFSEKTKALQGHLPILPVPVDGRGDLWDRAAIVYEAFSDARHAVTHRRAKVGSSGELEIYDNNRALAETISTAEGEAFVAAVHALAEAVIDTDPDARRMNIIAWHLNTLSARHRLPRLAATDPEIGHRRLVADLLVLDDGRVRFDRARAQEIVDGQDPSLWDLELRHADRVFRARWENVPPSGGSNMEFDPAAPPGWLAESAP